MGIGHPGERNEVVNYVLKAPRREEQELIDPAIRPLPAGVAETGRRRLRGAHSGNFTPKPFNEANRNATDRKDTMSLKCGIVGLPNVGKVHLFNALTKAGVAAENYPFCTSIRRSASSRVPDKRLAQLSAIVKPQRVVPAVTEFVDIAGLVAGASGRRLGNQFLANIRETDAVLRRALLCRRQRGTFRALSTRSATSR